jgi:sarcosine oxidase subunit alpha
MPRLPDPRFATDCTVSVDGRAVPARKGESIASALVAAGRPLLSRSAKYHRPRGPFCLSGSCGSCLVRVDGEPNQRACRTPCQDGLRVETQNAWPDAERDVLGLIDPLTPHGLDVHHMLTRPLPLNRALVAFTRRLAGSGRMPDRPAPRGPEASTENFYALVLGSGPAGLAAAEELARSGRRVLLAEQDLLLGGRLRAGLEPGFAPGSWPADVSRAVASHGGEVAVGTAAVGLWHDGGEPICLLVARSPARTRLVRASRILVCTGGDARPPVFQGCDLPGVFSGRALALALAEHGVVPGRRAAVLGTGPEAEAIVERFRAAGMEAVLVAQPPTRATGRSRVASLRLADGSKIPCDTVAQGASPAPSPDLLRALGVGVEWNPAFEAFAPRVADDGTTKVAGLFAAGEVARPVSGAEAAAWGRRAGEAARG